MLSLAQNAQSFFCIEWIPTENGPSVVNYNKIKLSNPLNSYKNFLDKVFNHADFNFQNDSKTITLSLDINNVGITSFKYDSMIPLEDFRNWYEKKILGAYIVDNYDIYYYPLEDTKENIVMVIYINKEVKQNILDSCLEHNCNLLHLTLDIFSANDSSKMFGSNSLSSYIIWKIMKNNYHYITYYKKGSLNHLIKVKKSKKLEIISSIGDEKTKNKLIKIFNSIFYKRKSKNILPGIDKIFIYQTKSNFDQINNIIAINSKKIRIMDIGSSFLNRKNMSKINYSLLSYNENGNSLRGVDV